MVGEKRPPYPPPNPVVVPDAGTHDPAPSRGRDTGFQHGRPGMTPMQDNRGGSGGDTLDSELVG